jgi:hypothetical protein
MDGAADRKVNSITYRRALARNDTGTRTAGLTRHDHLADAPTSRIEKIEVAMSIIGSDAAPSDVRNNASRVALPPMNCAVTAAAQPIAISVERDRDRMSVAL